jgi:hypothetical protein
VWTREEFLVAAASFWDRHKAVKWNTLHTCPLLCMLAVHGAHTMQGRGVDVLGCTSALLMWAAMGAACRPSYYHRPFYYRCFPLHMCSPFKVV